MSEAGTAASAKTPGAPGTRKLLEQYGYGAIQFTGADDSENVRHVGVARWRRGVKGERPGPSVTEDAVQDERVEVNIQSEAAAEALDRCHRAGPAVIPPRRREPENLSSRQLAAKLGFTEEGTLRDWLRVAGEFRSVAMYSLLRAEWMTRLEALPYRNV